MTHSKRSALWTWMPWTVLVVVALLVGTALWVSFGSDSEAGPGQGMASSRERAMPVVVEPVRAVSLAETVRGVGTLRAFESVVLRPEVAGRIETIDFEEGGTVEAGQVLFELDDAKLQRQLAARRASLRAAAVRMSNAQRSLERREQLAERGVVSPDELDRAREELDSAQAEQERAEAELALIEAELAEMRIIAPFDGVISQRHVDRGAYVTAGEALATLYQSDPVEVDFAVPERLVGGVQRGQRVNVTVAAYPDESFEGALHFISPAVDAATRTVRVRGRIANPDLKLKPGAFATVTLTVALRVDRPAIPAEALVATRTGYRVFVVDEGHARARAVRTGLRRDGLVEIVEGLDIGEQVVRSGHLRLSDGDAVRIVDDLATAAAELESN